MSIEFTIPARSTRSAETRSNSAPGSIPSCAHCARVVSSTRCTSIAEKGTVKRLIEEAIPVSRLGLYLSTPESEVHVRCFADGRSYDAEIAITGFLARSFKLEVTTSETNESTIGR